MLDTLHRQWLVIWIRVALGWRIVLGAAAIIAVIAMLVGGAFIADDQGAPVNILTEAAGVAGGTALTVLLIEGRRRRRERRVDASLRRHRLLAELTQNLSQMATRTGNSAFPNHRWMAQYREHAALTIDEVAGDVVITDRQGVDLLGAIVRRVRPHKLAITAVNQAIADGAFLDVDTAGKTIETPLHRTLERISSDLARLRQLEEPSEFLGGWDRELPSEIVRQRSQGQAVEYSVKGYHLLMARSYYDTAEDLFNEQVAACAALLHDTTEVAEPTRRPTTPLGESMEAGVRSEAVLPTEVQHLIEQDIDPFGKRIPASALGETPDQRARAVAAALGREVLSGAGVSLTPDELQALEVAAAKMLKSVEFAPPEEGIERIDHPSSDKNSVEN